MKFEKPKQFAEFDREYAKASESFRQQQLNRIGINQCYYEGVHYVSPNVRGPSGYQVGRLRTDYRAESNELRVQTNDYSRMIQKVSAGTRPAHIFVDGVAPELDVGIEAEVAAEHGEALANALIESSYYTSQARAANFERTIAGMWGIGLTLKYDPEDPENVKPIAFNFNPTHLIVDPFQKDHRLWTHDWVCYEDVWTLKKARSTFPHLKERLQDPTKFKTVGELEPIKKGMNSLSGGRLYAQYAMHSKTRGVRVRQWHIKTGMDRFDRWYVVIDFPEEKNQEENVVNFDDSETPFGGCGMPFVLLRGHARSEAPAGVGLSDGDMFRVSQDMVNLGESLWWRIQQTYGAPMTVVDRRMFGPNSSDDDIRGSFTNRVGNIVIGDLSGRQRHGNPVAPQFVQGPAPHPSTRDAIERATDSMRESAHKAPGSFGDVKTHVTSDAFNRSQDEAGEVSDERIQNDVEAHEKLISVLHATGIKHVKEEVPAILGLLRRAGMDEEGFGDLIREDENQPFVTIKVRDESIRYRSHRQRRIDLETAAQNQMIDPITYRITNARDLETPILKRDGQMALDAKKAARRVLLGEEWVPIDLGEYTELFVAEFRSAMFDKYTRNDPEARDRLSRAIDSQRQKSAQAAMAADPELLAQQLQAEQAQDTIEQEQPAPVTVSDLLDGIREPQSA
jgi:hypothetical protein